MFVFGPAISTAMPNNKLDLTRIFKEFVLDFFENRDIIESNESIQSKDSIGMGFTAPTGLTHFLLRLLRGMPLILHI